jgi:hypothetical protein
MALKIKASSLKTTRNPHEIRVPHRATFEIGIARQPLDKTL